MTEKYKTFNFSNKKGCLFGSLLINPEVSD